MYLVLAMTRERFPILAVNFIGILGYSVVVPILIFLVEKMGGNAFVYGILGAVYPAFQLVGSPWLGRLSDRIGRKKVLLLSQAGTFLAWLLFILAIYLPVEKILFEGSGPDGFLVTLPLACLFVARALDGFTGGNIAVANAYMADISDEQNRSENFGQMSASMSLAFVLGPALAGLLSTTALEELLPVLVAAVISLVTMILIQLWLKETIDLPRNPTRPRRILSRFFGQAHKSCRNPESRQTKFKDLLQLENIPLMFLLYLMVFLSFSLFYVGFPVYSSQVLGWSAKELGGFLAISSLIMFGVNTYGIKFLNRYTDPRQLILTGAMLMAASFTLLTFENFLALATANVLLSVGNGILWPSFMSVLSESSPSDKIGGIMGWGNSMGSLGSILGLLIGGFLYTHIGSGLFLLGALSFTCIFLLILFFFGNRKKKNLARAT